MKKIIYVGLDVHKESISIAYTTSHSRRDARYFDQCGGSNLAAERALRKLVPKVGVPFKELHFCYACPARTRASPQRVA